MVGSEGYMVWDIWKKYKKVFGEVLMFGGCGWCVVSWWVVGG